MIIISGKAQVGKTTTANMIKNYCTSLNIKSVVTSYAKYIKMYTKDITDWNGEEEDKPREVLQSLGDVIRDYLKKLDFLIKRLDEDIDFYKLFVNICIIDDARYPEEIDFFKQKYASETISIQIQRPDFESNLKFKEKNHKTEQMLDNYNHYDYTIINDGTLEDLKDKVQKLLRGVIK